MGIQQYVIRYFNPKLHSAPIIDKQTGRPRGGHDGWTEFYVYGGKTALKKAKEMAGIVGKDNVICEPFNDPVKNPYKRRKDKKNFKRQDRDEVSIFD